MASAHENGESGALPPEPPVSEAEGDRLSGYTPIEVRQVAGTTTARTPLWPFQRPSVTGHCDPYNFRHRCFLAVSFSWMAADSSGYPARDYDEVVLFKQVIVKYLFFRGPTASRSLVESLVSWRAALAGWADCEALGPLSVLPQSRYRTHRRYHCPRWSCAWTRGRSLRSPPRPG